MPSRSERERHRRSDLKRRYGITVDDYDLLWGRQRGRCACCGSTDVRGRGDLHVDHDHQTGKVRGLLCFPCNSLLGKVEAEGGKRLDRVLAYRALHHPAEDNSADPDCGLRD